MSSLPKTPISDLRVIIHDTTLVYPAKPVPHRNMFLPNIDQVLNFDVQTIHFFEPKTDFPPDVVMQKLRTALSEILVPYNFLSGRIRLNDSTKRLEFDCNSAGIGFVSAASDYALDDIGSLVYPNPAFEQLVTMQITTLDSDDQPLCIFQVTSFKCGGFAMGVSAHHATSDGLSFKMFLDNLGAVAAGKPLLFQPCNDRELLAARSPPRISFPHPELLKLDQLPSNESTIFDNTDQQLDFTIFPLSSSDIDYLKKQTRGNSAARATSFNVVTAHIWRCKALSSADPGTKTGERLSTMLYTVDIRSKLSPALPNTFTGNAVLTAYATTSCKELEEGPFDQLVELVTAGSSRMTDEYARSTIDWLELHKGFPNGEFLLSSWWRLGFTRVAYPWGTPRYSCPLVYHHRKDIILLLPNDHTITADNNQVNVLVALPPNEMLKFKSIFHRFLKPEYRSSPIARASNL